MNNKSDSERSAMQCTQRMMYSVSRVSGLPTDANLSNIRFVTKVNIKTFVDLINIPEMRIFWICLTLVLVCISKCQTVSNQMINRLPPQMCWSSEARELSHIRNIPMTTARESRHMQCE